ncbi:EAL domain-containing protein [Zoogloea sp.]|uniref:EAL domain-containing protein n=1 Tax=Zoogloea sp. TaxID=49181 RepID=UPI001416AE21|nr:MAG: EAL domain-containing protein [Zoogloea sp.]
MPLADLVHYFNKRNRLLQGGTADDCFEVVDGRVRARMAGSVFGTLFQPIVDCRSGRVAGHEALLRVIEGPWVGLPAQAVYLEMPDDPSLVQLDRRVRTLHALNFLLQQEQEGGFLALNVHSQLLRSVRANHGLAFEAILARCGLSPERIVLEIPDDGFDPLLRLTGVLEAYRARGYRIAIDNFGRHTACLDRLETLAPDIVKLDRSLVGHAGHLDLARRVMAELAEELRRIGAAVICQCIESPLQSQAAEEAGVEFVQGFLVGRPAEQCLPVAGPRRPREAA